MGKYGFTPWSLSAEATRQENKRLPPSMDIAWIRPRSYNIFFLLKSSNKNKNPDYIS